MVRHMFIAQFRWLSTHDNVEADDLSRDREQDFLRHMAEHALWSVVGLASAYIYRHPACGEVATLEGFDDWAIVAPAEVSCWEPEEDGVCWPSCLTSFGVTLVQWWLRDPD